MATKSIGVSEATAQDLAREASKHKVSRDMIIAKMLDFFRTYGIDPFNYDAPVDEMQKIIKRFDQMFAFLKKQEKDMLIPTLGRVATKEDTAPLTTKEDILEQNKIHLAHMNELLRMLRGEFKKVREENEELKNQLEEARKQNHSQHEQVYQEITNDVSRMLQAVVGGMKGLSIKDKDKGSVLKALESYEH